MRNKYNAERELYSFPNEKGSVDRTDWVLAYTFVIVGGLAAAALFYNAVDERLGFMTAGLVMMICGILRLIEKRESYPEQKLRPIGAIILGFGLAAATLLSCFGEKTGLSYDAMMMSSGAVFVFSSCGIGGLILAEPIVRAVMKKKRCTERVMAECVDVKPVWSGKGGTVYEHVWEYPLGSIKVRAGDGLISTREKPYIGTLQEIFTNPDDPNDIWRKARVSFTRIFAGVMLTAIGLFVFYVLWHAI